MQQTDNTLASANKLFSERRYQEAIPLYEECLPKLTTAYGQENPQVAVCLQGLGDSCLAVERYDRAAEAYALLIAVGEKLVGDRHPDVISTIFKNARCYDRMGRAHEAKELYAFALALADETMPDSPFVGSVIDSYLSMLKRTGVDPQLAQRLEERLYGSQEIMQSTGDMPALEEDKEKAYNEAVSQVQAQRGGSLRNRMQTAEEETEETTRKDWFKHNVKEKPQIWLAVLAIVIVLPLGALVLNRMPSAAPNLVEAKAKKELSGSSFQSADGLKKIDFVDGQTVSVTAGANTKRLPYEVSAEPETKLTADQLSCSGDHVVDSDGTILYRTGARELKMSQTMLKLAGAADRCFKETGEYPQELNQWKERTFINPYTNAEETVTIDFAGTDGSWRPDAPTDRPASEMKLIEEAPDAEQLKAKSAIICGYTVTKAPDSKMKALAFFVRGKDSEGKLLTGSHPGVVYALSMLNGRPPEVAGQFASRSFTSPEGKVTVFKR